MSTVEIYIGDTKLDIYSDVNYAVTLQANDFAELRTRQYTHSNKWKLPKTSKNKSKFELLSFSGSIATIQYRVVRDLRVVYNGVQVVHNGYGYFKDTDKDYNLVIYDGLIDFLDSINGLTLENLDYSDINHNYGLTTMQDSWTNTEGYIYGVCKTINPLSGIAINIDLPCPTLFIKTILDKIEDISGYTFEGDLVTDPLFLKTVMSTKRSFILPTENYTNVDTQFKIYNLGTETVYSDPTPLPLIGGNYVKLKVNWTYSGTTGTRPRFEILVNGVEVGHQLMNDTQGEAEFEVYGLNVEIRLAAENTNGIQSIVRLDVESSRLEDTPYMVQFADLIGDLTLKEFLKQIITKFGINIYPDVRNKILYFDYINNYNDADVVDISDIVNPKNKESYNLGSYGKDNIFAYGYDEGQEENSNGVLPYGNETGESIITHFTSAFNAPNFASDKYENLYFKFSDELEINEQSLKLFHIEDVQDSYELRVYGGLNGDAINNIKFLDFQELKFQALLNQYYVFLRERLFKEPKKITLPIKLNALRFSNYRLQDVYYIKQEASLFLISKIKYNSRSQSTAEFIRVGRKESDLIPPVAVIEGVTLFTNGTPALVELFGENSYDLDGFVTTWNWTIYDNNNDIFLQSSTQNISFIIPANTTYQACLTVTDNSGLTHSVCKSVKNLKATGTNVYDNATTIEYNMCWVTKQFTVNGTPNTIKNFLVETSITNGGSNTFVNLGSAIPTDCFVGGCTSLGLINNAGQETITVMLDATGKALIQISLEAYQAPGSTTANSTMVVVSDTDGDNPLILINKQWTNEALC